MRAEIFNRIFFDNFSLKMEEEFDDRKSELPALEHSMLPRDWADEMMNRNLLYGKRLSKEELDCRNFGDFDTHVLPRIERDADDVTTTYFERSERDCIRKYGYPLPIFAKEFLPPNQNAKPCRTLWHGSYATLIATYLKQFKPTYRTYHEVIVEDHPCHLYYDLDISREECANPEDFSIHRSVTMYLMFKSILGQVVASLFGSWPSFSECEACNENKFSVHGIVHIPKTAFRNSFVVGEVMNYVMNAAKWSGYSQLWWTAKLSTNPISGEENAVSQRFIADMAIYNRNHSLRMYGSTKVGAQPRFLIDMPMLESLTVDGLTEALLAPERMKLKSNGQIDLQKEQLIDSLVQYLVYDDQIVDLAIDLHAIIDTYENLTAFEFKPSIPYRQRGSNRLIANDATSFGQKLEQLCLLIEKQEAEKISLSRRRIKMPFDQTIIIIDTTTTYCLLVKSNHGGGTGNHQRIEVDLARKQYFIKCYRPACRRLKECRQINFENFNLLDSILGDLVEQGVIMSSELRHTIGQSNPSIVSKSITTSSSSQTTSTSTVVASPVRENPLPVTTIESGLQETVPRKGIKRPRSSQSQRRNDWDSNSSFSINIDF